MRTALYITGPGPDGSPRLRLENPTRIAQVGDIVEHQHMLYTVENRKIEYTFDAESGAVTGEIVSLTVSAGKTQYN